MQQARLKRALAMPAAPPNMGGAGGSERNLLDNKLQLRTTLAAGLYRQSSNARNMSFRALRALMHYNNNCLSQHKNCAIAYTTAASGSVCEHTQSPDLQLLLASSYTAVGPAASAFVA